jgi:flagellin
MPGLVINTNVASINGQRNLYKSSLALNKSLERLSSGLRINRAGDDAAGLAISENLRSQVRGLNQAVRNANDGISLIQTAEGAIDTYTEICQRMRELSIQASSDVNSDENRKSIQLEINQQLDELNRIATTMDFNGAKLFDGTFIDKKIQVGAKAGQTLDISVGDLRTSMIGAVARTVGTAVNATAFVAGGILVNGYQVGASASATAIDKAAAIQAIYNQTGVTATAEATTVTGTGVVGGGTLNATHYFIINGVTFGSATDTIITLANDSDGALRRAINAKSNVTGVVASVNTSNQLVLTAADGRDIDVTLSTVGVAPTAQFITGLSGAAGAGVLAKTGGTIQLTSDSAFVVADGSQNAATLVGFEGSIAVDYNLAINTLDVSTFDNAQDALDIIDNALRQINDVRANLGAITNRLENTVSNLMIVAENLSASDSRIRDADFAAETANMTRAQILQQSGVAVLAQANVVPQAALQLLQG